MDKHTNSAFKVINQEFMKLDRFDGTNYTHWKDKMMFFLTALKVAYVLDSNLPWIPVSSPDETENVKEEHTKCQEDELLCRGHILNTLSNCLYDLFTSVQSPREIWNALEFKYNTEKQGADKFLSLQFFEFNMVDHISVLDQVHELQILVSKLKDLKVDVGEPLQVGAIIVKLPPSRNDYRNKLQKHLIIEEETRIRDGKRLET